jgi:hypothetical protein
MTCQLQVLAGLSPQHLKFKIKKAIAERITWTTKE